MKILIVDDSMVSRMTIKSSLPIFISQTSEIFEAKDGQEGVDKYKEISPDVVFLDLTMPILTGYEALEQIIEFDKDAKVIVLSADSQPKAVQRVTELGAKWHKKKPVTKEDMVYIFKEILKKEAK